uniref:Uncharacterized protein n=1 Tax=Rhizophora mucronata TaxID=61149 RepID=A0A2P2MJH6_RHIMU
MLLKNSHRRNQKQSENLILKSNWKPMKQK